MKYVITYFPGFRKAALNETKKADGVFVRDLARNLSIVEFEEALPKDPIFIRHIMPINATSNTVGGVSVVFEKVKEITNLSSGDNFSVQCRLIGGYDFSAKDVEVKIGTHFDELGAVPCFSDYGLVGDDDVFVISVLAVDNELFCGFSRAADNYNFHSDEYRLLSRGSGREISRAENKLKEAIHKFKINITGEGFALDCGASPGGWSKVLADYGFTVYAVDPGDLKPELLENPRIKHFKAKIQDLEFGEKFELAVNDMNIEPQLTAEIMNVLAHNLEADARAVVTLKLPFSDIGRSIDESLEILDKNYELLALKNLTHNRQEVTAYLRRK